MQHHGGIVYKGIFACCLWCRRHHQIDETNVSTLVAVDQCAVHCLEETVWLFTVMRSKCRSSRAYVTLCRPLPVFEVVRCSSENCFQTLITVELFHCTRAATAR